MSQQFELHIVITVQTGNDDEGQEKRLTESDIKTFVGERVIKALKNECEQISVMSVEEVSPD